MRQSATVNVTIPVSTPSTIPVLGAGDFTYLGYYVVNNPSGKDGYQYGMGLTHRYVGGQLRFLTFAYGGSMAASAILREFAPPAAFGGTVNAITGEWLDIWTPTRKPNVGGGDEYSLWWEDQGGGLGRLWTTHCTDYPDAAHLTDTQSVTVRNLNSSGTVSNIHGEWGFQGIGQRAIYGPVQPIPAWFRTRYGLAQPYAVGWGGYASLMGQGLTPSLGPFAAAVPDPSLYPDGSVVPSSAIRVMCDFRSGVTGNDWYPSGAPTVRDRGRRNASVTNYYDGGDPRPNPSTPPSVPPAAGAQWLSPAPDSYGRAVWGDSSWGGTCWIDGPVKQGLVSLWTLATGKAWYGTSSLHCDSRAIELQVFDPDDFGRVMAGTLSPFKCYPVATKQLTSDLQPLGSCYGVGGNNPTGGAAGATFDLTTKRLYVWSPQVPQGAPSGKLYCYGVNC